MITTANYIIKAVVNGSTFIFQYDETMDVWETLGEFWHEDYPEVLADVQGSGLFPMDVYAMGDGNGKVIAVYPFTFNHAVFHAFFDNGFKHDGHFTVDEFLDRILRKDKNYGMTIQYICDRIAEFTGDKKKEAMRKAKIFRKNCRVPLTDVKDLRLSFGRTEHEDGTTTENRDTLRFRYKDSTSSEYVFSIID